MTHFVIIETDGGGVISHKNVDLDKINLPENAETFDNVEGYKKHLSEIRNSQS